MVLFALAVIRGQMVIGEYVWRRRVTGTARACMLRACVRACVCTLQRPAELVQPQTRPQSHQRTAKLLAS
eukprot:355656-Chlamydomonas_euryale.AAC.2